MSSEAFVFGHRTFDITEAKTLIAEHRCELVMLDVQKLVPLLMLVEVDEAAADALPDEALDEPLIAARDDDGVLLIDGYHRVFAAARRRVSRLAAHTVDAHLVELPAA